MDYQEFLKDYEDEIFALRAKNAELETQLAQAEFQRDAALEGWRIVGEQLAALQWSEISESNLPKRDDEVMRPVRGEIDALKYGSPWVIVNVTGLCDWWDMSAEDWLATDWTHRRPINAPARAAESEGA